MHFPVGFGSWVVSTGCLLGVTAYNAAHSCEWQFVTSSRRPLQQLYPLEISGVTPQPNSRAGDTTSSEDAAATEPEAESSTGLYTTPKDVPEKLESSTAERRPVRAAAKAATQKKRAWIQELQGQD